MKSNQSFPFHFFSYFRGPAEGDLDCIACKCNASRTDYEVTSHARFMKDRSHQMIGGFNRAETGYGIGFEYPSDKMSSSVCPIVHYSSNSTASMIIMFCLFEFRVCILTPGM